MVTFEVDLDEELGALVHLVVEHELELLLALVVAEVGDLAGHVSDGLVLVEEALVVNELEVHVVLGVVHVVLPVAAEVPLGVAALASVGVPLVIGEVDVELGLEVFVEAFAVAENVGGDGVDRTCRLSRSRHWHFSWRGIQHQEWSGQR